jgi:hypothetical protein
MKQLLSVAAGAALLVLAAAPHARAQSGSYTASCRNIASLGNGAISAECADGSGHFRSSTLAAGQCKGDIGNQNGLLACNGAVAQGGPYVPDNNDRNSGRGSSNGGRGNGYGDNGYGNGGNGYGGNGYGGNGRQNNGGGGRYGNDNGYGNGGGYGGSYPR